NLPDSINTGNPLRLRNPDARDDLADDFLRSTVADIREGHGEAFYVPSRDFISMPAFEAFKGADHFYNVAFHELTHWTAHKSRLDRDLKNRFGSRQLCSGGTDCRTGRSCVQNLALMVTSGMRATSSTVSSSSRPTNARSSQHAAR